MTDDTLLYQIIDGLVGVLERSAYEDARRSAANSIETIVRSSNDKPTPPANYNDLYHYVTGCMCELLKNSPYEDARVFATKTLSNIIGDLLGRPSRNTGGD